MTPRSVHVASCADTCVAACPVAGIASVLMTSPQVSQCSSFSPGSVQVACFVTTHSPSLWPFAAISRVSSTSPQTSQARCSLPASVHVGSFTVCHVPES